MTVDDLISKVRKNPDTVEFDEVMRVIDESYDYTPTDFLNGQILNKAGSNEGSCKIFYFAQQNNLSETETLALFGRFYREDVLGDPAGEDHLNIRNFIMDGWVGIKFKAPALNPKTIH